MDVFISLSDEWATMIRTPSTNARYRRWQESDPELGRWSSLDDLIHFAQRRGDPAASDRALAILARRASSDELAARALLQALLPGLRAMVIQHYWLADDEELTASALALAWEHIRTYPFATRPCRIAANVLRDTAHHLRRSHRPQIPPRTYPAADVPLIVEDYDSVALLDLARRTIDRTATAIVIRTRISGESVTSVAAEMRCTTAALRERRRRAELRIKAALTQIHDSPARQAS